MTTIENITKPNTLLNDLDEILILLSENMHESERVDFLVETKKEDPELNMDAEYKEDFSHFNLITSSPYMRDALFIDIENEKGVRVQNMNYCFGETVDFDDIENKSWYIPTTETEQYKIRLLQLVDKIKY